MSDNQKNELLNKIDRIELSDTISQFMEKCNNNFAKIAEVGGGPAGVKGDVGSQGVPTKPKVPIHVWKKTDGVNNNDYKCEEPTENGFEIKDLYNNLSDNIYQAGHLILLENAHVYRLEVNDEDQSLIPKFMYAMDSYDIDKIDNEKKAYVYFMYAESKEELLTEGVPEKNIITDNNRYIGICSNNSTEKPTDLSKYVWNRMGDDGESAYVHFKYADSKEYLIEKGVSDEKINTENNRYIGICSSNSVNASDELKDYTWSRMGDDGESAYVHFNFKDNTDLSKVSGILNKLHNNEYIGICSSNSVNAPSELTEYDWIKVRSNRVLFYLGSFKNGTLTGDSVYGKLTDSRCDCYIDSNGVGWIRKGTKNNSKGLKNGNESDTINWEKIDDANIGFLTDGVINVDAINADEFAKKIFCKDVISNVGYIPDLLNTNQYSNEDKVVVSGNNIKIINSDGYTTTLITSDEINIEKDEMYYNNNTFNIIYNILNAATELTNINSQYYEIGYINDYSNIEFTLIASLSNSNDSENIIWDNWSFVNDKQQGNLYLTIERYDVDSNKWEEKRILEFINSTGSWVACDYIGNEIKTDDENYYTTPYKTKTKSTTLNEQEGGTYRFKICIDNINSNSSFNNVLLKTKCNVSNNKKDDEIYDNIKIGKNGIVVNLRDVDNNQKTEFNVLKNEILMKVGSFGLKITNEGIYTCKNDTWEEL